MSSWKREEFSDYADGEALKSSGNEEIFQCQGCGKRKLYRNTETGNWYCFVCGIGGHDPITKLGANTPRGFISPYLNYDMVGGGIFSPDGETVFGRKIPTNDLLQMRGEFSHDHRMVNKVTDVHVKLRDHKDRMIGVHSWSMFQGYRTVGRRGIASYKVTRDLDWFLCEGLWDWLAVSALVSHSGRGQLAVFLAGNRLSQDQRDVIVSNFPAKIHLCLDSDLEAPVMEMQRELSSLGIGTEVKRPWLKDWWDCYEENKERAREELNA